MTFTDDEISALEAGSQRIGLFIRLETDPVLRLWLGVGPIKPGTNAIDATDELYLGAGEILSVPEMQQLINGAAERIELSLSGLDDNILALASFSDEVQGVACDIGLGLFAPDWSLLGAVHWMRHYIADYLSMTITPAGDPQGQTTKTATLSIGSLMTGRRRRGLSYFNDQDQQARAAALDPDADPDLFCERTHTYSVQGQKTWPKY